VTRSPVIGVCAPLENARWSFWDMEAVIVPASYHRAVLAAEGITVALTPDARLAAEPDTVLDVLDGLILIGGADVDPSMYGAAPDPATERTYTARDRCEISLAARALQRGIPLLGICRGLQILNVALGGTLVQDLDAEVGSSLHRRNRGSFDGTDHVVRIEPGSLAHRATGELEHVVHCHHHQAVDLLGAGLVVSARAAVDGVVEAVEAPGEAFALGVQWHPEANERSQVIGALVAAARERVGIGDGVETIRTAQR
jgi:putative glutamine amidotransferase